MIHINLLPFKAKRKKGNVHQQIIIFILLVAGVASGLYWYNSKLNDEIKALQDQIEYTKKEIVRYNKIAKEVEEIKEKLVVLKNKLKIIDELDSNRLSAFNILNIMSDMVVEKKMWFTKFEAINKTIKQSGKRGKKKKPAKKDKDISIQKTEIQIRIDGIALDNKTVADFMTRLEQSNTFNNVRLITLKQQKFKQSKDSVNLKSFQVACKKMPLIKPDDNKKNKKDKK